MYSIEEGRHLFRSALSLSLLSKASFVIYTLFVISANEKKKLDARIAREEGVREEVAMGVQRVSPIVIERMHKRGLQREV